MNKKVEWKGHDEANGDGRRNAWKGKVLVDTNREAVGVGNVLRRGC